VAEEFAKSDLQGAVKWMKNISDAKLRAAAFESMAAEWAKADPLAAGSFALETPDVNTIETRLSNRGLNERQQAILMVVQQWSNSDPAAAIRWAAQLPEADQLHGHVVSAAEIWARSNPQEAARFVAGELKPGPLQEQAATEIVKIWSATDPAAAAQWALQFP
jgi:hypothetical protein